jgi:mono/diheme cytochrome c family protein
VFLTTVVALIAVLSAQSCPADDGITAEQADFFESRIRPVLVAHCYECHSADAKVPKGGLRLDLRDTTLAGGDSGPAVVPGKASDSHLLSALRYEGFEMPPKGRLPESIISDFERWIEMGAPDPRSAEVTRQSAGIDYEKAKEFWAFTAPMRHQPPAVANEVWSHNDIDRFILHELESRGLKPAVPADRRTLIRRAYFDLIGLPPEPDVVEQFVNDSSASAFEKVIDDLLASPHYGERWGRYWLDLARFAEDQAHTFKARMYPQGYIYRDWVVQALNDDIPYDQFLRLQIAGDQLQLAEEWQHRVALGLFALGPVYYQDNGEQDRALADEWDDRIDTLMRGTQALTVSCARCHDHKYDPISMADYYGLAGIFASSEYRELPAVPDAVVEARRRADEAVQDQQLQINVLLANHAPAARLKLTTMIPRYMVAASKVLQAGAEKRKDRKFLERTADADKLNVDLLQRWVAWLSEEPGSGATSSERPYLNAWRKFSKDEKSGESQPKEERAAEVTSLAEQLQKLAESLISQREMLRHRFGDNFAYVSADDRAAVEPGTVPLGNLFDDQKGAVLSSAVSTDPFRSAATSKSLGVERIAQGWGGTTQIADGIHFNFKSIGSDSRQHGQITNDGWSADGGIRTQGTKCSASLGRTEQGIGMHANSLITFDLDEIRRSGFIPASESMTFRVDRAGINDDAFGDGASVHIAVVVSRPHQNGNTFDAILAGYLDGQPATVAENDKVYYFDGTIPAPIKGNGRFVAFNVPLPPEARYLTIATTGAQLSETENTISSDHAVLSNARLVYQPTPEQLARVQGSELLHELSDEELAQSKISATLLSELFDDRGVLGLAPDQIEPWLDGEPAATVAQMKTELEAKTKAAAAIAVTMAHTLTDGTGRDLKIYLAGDPKKQGDAALRAFPAILTSGQRRPFDPQGSGRRELAEAITSPANPLTARVIVNRVWAGHFGFGLVRTLSNFGQLGERPSHPELLDSLAVELMESGWSLKHLHRKIMLSATYQQGSSGDAANLETDPENRLLWQMNRRRLEVEPWRDAVLSVSGQLNRDVGGPSSELDGNHRRRTLYGFVSRHRLNDLLRLFDFPDPNITAGERTVTTVPLQQLFVLNSDFMVTQSKALAARLQNECSSDDERIHRAFELLFGRQPSVDEHRTALEFLASSAGVAGDSLTPLEQYCLAMLGTNEFAYVD